MSAKMLIIFTCRRDENHNNFGGNTRAIELCEYGMCNHSNSYNHTRVADEINRAKSEYYGGNRTRESAERISGNQIKWHTFNI